MDRENGVYVAAMQDALKNKLGILEKILEITMQQEGLLSASELDMEQFDELLGLKDILLQQLLDLDQGFQGLYEKIEYDLKANKEEYRSQILKMQNLIRENTDLGVKIQALEQRNKQRFEYLSGKKRQEIQEFRLNHKTSGMYAKHMANQYQEGQGYFVDKKK